MKIEVAPEIFSVRKWNCRVVSNRNVATFMSASETHNKKNVNRTIRESLAGIEEVRRNIAALNPSAAVIEADSTVGLTRRVAGSSRSPATSTTASSASGARRRSTARTRAISSLGEKGLVR